MKCPKCGQAFGKTYITRHKEKSIRRRRICQECGFRWTTVEMPIDDMSVYTRSASEFLKDMKRR